MSTNRSRWWKFACTLPGLGLAGWLAWSTAHTHAQEVAANSALTKAYLNKTTINLPILVDERHRGQLDSVQLYVKKGASQPWKLCDKAPPTQASFVYRASAEGEYWFNIVSVDKNGRMTPADVNKEAPALIVVLDTQAPQVEVLPLQSAAEGQYVRCNWQDANLDAQKSRFFYQSSDQVWRSVDPQPGTTDTFCIPSQAAWTGNVRAVAMDLAGNSTTRELKLNTTVAQSVPPALPVTPLAAAAAATQPGQLPPPLPGAPVALSGLSQVQAMPMPTRGRSLAANDVIVPATNNVASTTADAPPATPKSLPEKTATDTKPAPASALVPPQLFDPIVAKKSQALASSLDVKTTSLLTREPAAIQRQFTNVARMFLDYRIEAMGASGVGKVEVWYTRDMGQSWQKLCEDSKRQSPVEINLPGDGVYGITMVITNGRGFGGAPPLPGDTPDTWIELDTTKPIAELMQVRAGNGDDSGALHIGWTARDKNLSNDSVELQYSPTREGPWQSIAKGLKAEGIYRWLPPIEIGPQAYIRLTVRDQANNVSTAETQQPVALDDASRPRGRVMGFTATAPKTGTPVLQAP